MKQQLGHVMFGSEEDACILMRADIHMERAQVYEQKSGIAARST